MGYDAQKYQLRLGYALTTLDKDKDILESNKATIIKYKDESLAKGLSLGRIVRCIYIIRSISKYMEKDFYEATKDDIVKAVGKIETGNYSHTTKCEMKITLKKFYSWLRNCEDGEHPPEVKWIKIKKKRSERIAEQMLTEDEIKKLIDSCFSVRDKALIAVLYESGCRAGELLGMRLKDLTKDQYGFKAVLDGKTGMRKIRLLSSAPYLIEWLNKHPEKSNPNAPVWISRMGNHLGYVTLLALCRMVKLKTGITKPCNPHSFRHSRATYLAGHLSDSLLKEYMGWTQSSNMTAVYVHLNGKQLDDELFKLHGIKKKEEFIDKLTPKICYCCSFENEATNIFCARCGTILDRNKMIDKIETDAQKSRSSSFLDEMLRDTEFAQVFEKRIKEVMRR